jgi:hypothetical protein
MGSVIDSAADFVGDVVGGVGDVVGEAGDFVGDVIETAADNPVETALALAAIYYGAPYLAGQAAAGEAALAAGVADTFGASTAAEIAAAEAASAAAYTGGTGLTQTLVGSTPGLTVQAIAEGAVPVATQGLFGAGGTFNPLAGSLLSNIIPSTPTDFLTSFIPKTPGEIANTLGLVTTLAGATQIPQAPSVNMTIPPSNVPRYGTGQTIFNAYNSAKGNINNILYPQGLLGTQQPRTAGIYSNYLQQQGLI